MGRSVVLVKPRGGAGIDLLRPPAGQLVQRGILEALSLGDTSALVRLQVRQQIDAWAAVDVSVKVRQLRRLLADAIFASDVLSIPGSGSSLTVIPLNMQPAWVGRAFFGNAVTIGGTPPYVYADTSGLGIGLKSDGSLQGFMTSAGNITVTGTVIDSLGATGTVSIPLSVLSTSGTLAISTTTLPNCTGGGAGFVQVVVTGGKPPYVGVLSSLSGAFTPRIDGDAYNLVLACNPTAAQAGTASFTLTVTDSAGSTASQSLSWTADTTLRQTAVDYTQSSTAWPSLMVGNKCYIARYAAGGSLGALAFNATLASGATGGSLTAGFPGSTGTYNVTFSNGNVRTCTMVNASTAVTWTGGLTSGATASANITIAWSVQSGALPAGTSLSTAGVVTGTPTTSTSGSVTLRATDGTNADDRLFAWVVNAAQTESRPTPLSGWSAGSSFYVSASGRLYSASGKASTLRGTNGNHYDDDVNQPSSQRRMGAISSRNFNARNGTPSAATIATYLGTYVSAGSLPMDCFAGFPSGSGVTGDTSPANLGALFNYVAVTAKAALLSTWNSTLLNLANEWGPETSVWRDAYMRQSGSVTSVTGGTITISNTSNPISSTAVTAGYMHLRGVPGVTDQLVPISASGGSAGAWTFTTSSTSLTSSGAGGTLEAGFIGVARAAGCTGPLVIDAPGNGQGYDTLLTYGVAVAQSDPLKNIILSLHIYGYLSNVECPITGITKATNGVVSCTEPAAFMPGAAGGSPWTNGINFRGYNGVGVYVQGALGMSQINGLTLGVGSYGSSSPYACNTTTNTSTFGTWTSGGFVYGTNHCALVIMKLAALQAQGVCCIVGEFGPSNPPLANGSGSDTWVTRRQVMDACEAGGIGWLAWAMDDSNGTHDPNGYAQAGANVTGQGKSYYASITNASYGGLWDAGSPYSGYSRYAQPVSDYL